MDDRITELEMKVSFQDQAIDELNGLLVDQQKEIDRLKSMIEALQTLQNENEGEGVKDISLEVPPPHY